jgi:hypothetical protein
MVHHIDDLKRREEWFDGTVNLDEFDFTGPKHLLALLYEDWLAASVPVVFGSDYLDILLKAGIIDVGIKGLCLQIAEKGQVLFAQPWVLAEEIQRNSRW